MDYRENSAAEVAPDVAKVVRRRRSKVHGPFVLHDMLSKDDKETKSQKERARVLMEGVMELAS